MTPARLLAIPAGVAIRGVNVTSGPQHTAGWRTLWSDWDWDGWIRPQIDQAISLGANCVRILGCIEGATGGYYTMQDYLARWRQFLDYCALHGVMAYPCGGSLRWTSAATIAQVQAVIGQWASIMDSYPGVIGLDVTNEYPIAGTLLGLQPVEIYNYIKALSTAARDVTGKALTNSLTANNATQWDTVNTSKIYPFNDFYDFHSYYQHSASDMASFLSSQWADKPLLLGEFGADMTLDSTARAARYSAARALIMDVPQFVGALAWAARDTDATPAAQLGMFDAAGAERTDVTTIYRTFPATR